MIVNFPKSFGKRLFFWKKKKKLNIRYVACTMYIVRITTSIPNHCQIVADGLFITSYCPWLRPCEFRFFANSVGIFRDET